MGVAYSAICRQHDSAWPRKTPTWQRKWQHIYWRVLVVGSTLNRLRLNRDKTQRLLCTLSHTLPSNDSSVELLGVVLNPQLTCDDLVTQLYKRISRVLFLLKKLMMTYQGFFHAISGTESFSGNISGNL